MLYQIRQKIFSFGDDFTIRNGNGEEVLVVKGKVFSLGNKLRINNMQGEELYYIEQKLFKLLPQYTVYANGQEVASVKKEFAFFKNSFHIESIYGNFTMDGNFFAHDFEILKNGQLAATISKKWFSFSDTYGVEISDNENQPFILALVIVIDQVLHDSDGSKNR